MSGEAKRQEEDVQVEKQGYLAWIKEHQKQLALAGMGAVALTMTVLGLKNREAITEMWESLQELIKKGSLGSDRWLRNSSLEELQKARNVIHQEYLNPENDMGYRELCWTWMMRIDEAIRSKRKTSTEYVYPAHGEHGWHLPSDD